MAMETVTLNYEGHYGYVEFDEATKQLNIYILSMKRLLKRCENF